MDACPRREKATSRQVKREHLWLTPALLWYAAAVDYLCCLCKKGKCCCIFVPVVNTKTQQSLFDNLGLMQLTQHGRALVRHGAFSTCPQHHCTDYMVIRSTHNIRRLTMARPLAYIESFFLFETQLLNSTHSLTVLPVVAPLVSLDPFCRGAHDVRLADIAEQHAAGLGALLHRDGVPTLGAVGLGSLIARVKGTIFSRLDDF